ncbi:SgcJ/EcaC family oxidoreductase [Nocardia sp. SYP-A9097]|uniref:SgcJ/EcaC family oxidoreductase n=1 Tax=Nocardia sp. SYP-A9097 TaxID=2663237 RepID=UPI00129A10CD|nr:SgcJ/EcaC family oxidoreductase [Nocardia sp. SYP-A9097]MRH86697.1 SgcJ/EcaC family oxidoreductase [Nocardia sp. SYP-A9097]
MSRAGATAPVIEDTTVDHTADITAITQVIANSQQAFNANDAELMAADYAANASAGNAVGMVMHGADAVRAASEVGLAGFLKNQYVRYDIADITFPRPDIALVHKLARETTATGELVDQEPAMVALYVLAKEHGRWWTIARHNTPIPRAD